MLINIVALEMLHAKIPSNSDSHLDSTGFSSESSSAVLNIDDYYKTKAFWFWLLFWVFCLDQEGGGGGSRQEISGGGKVWKKVDIR